MNLRALPNPLPITHTQINIHFQKGMYIKREYDQDYAYIFEIDENPNNQKFKIIWASSGQKDLLDIFEIQHFQEYDKPKEVELCGRCHIPLVQKISQSTKQKFFACPSYSLNKIGGYCKYPTKTIYDEPNQLKLE